MTEQPQFRLDRLLDTSDAAILDELRRVASLIDTPTITADAFKRVSLISSSTLRRRFGSWEAAFKAAGLESRLHPSARKLSDAQIVGELKQLARKLGTNELTVRLVERHLGISYKRLERSWGSAKAAFEAAGLATASVGQRYSDDERFENLLKVWTQLGRAPTYLEMSRPPSKIGGKAYKGRYGSWNKALAAFIERANSDEGESPQEIVVTTSPQRERDKRQGPRDVPLGLRFKVLRRDRFRCVLCGDSPPANADCVLHVDHIHPWSRGGVTELENLRTLCAQCNVGRSNHFTD